MIGTEYLLGIGTIMVLYAVYVVMKLSSSKLRKVPGPTPLPIIGNVHQLDTVRPFMAFTKWVKEYGDLFAIRLLSQDTIVINNPEIVHEALVTKGAAFAGRPYIYRAALLTYGNTDIAFQSYTPRLVYIRKLTHSALKSYGVGMARLEDIILQAVKQMLQEMQSNVDKPFYPQTIVSKTFCSIMTTIIIGKEFSSTDNEVDLVRRLDELVNEVLNPTNGAELDTFPWLRFFGNKCYKRILETIKVRNEFVDTQFSRLKETLDPVNVRGLFDALLIQQLEENGGPQEKFTDQEIKAVITDIIVGATNTTTTAVNISILLLIHHPDVQKRLHQEIDQVLENRLPHIDDRSMMPYTEAFIYEMMRYGSHVPLGLPRATMEDTVLAGYEIPKDTQVLINIWHIHHDERFYEDPWMFKPERFLDEDGNLVPADHPARRNFVAFGSGRRLCIGENLAKARLFLFVAALMQKFRVLSVDGEALPSADPKDFIPGLALDPKPYRIQLMARN